MDPIDYEDKDKTLPISDVRRLWRDVDANQVKARYNATIAEIPGLIAAAVNALVTGAPGALDTLNELAAALGDDPNFATTVANAIAAKQATLVSGTNIKTINGTSILGAGDIDLVGDLVAPILACFKSNIIPTGTINGTNPNFTFPDTPEAGTLKLYSDGVRVIGGGVDFTQTGPDIVMIIPPSSALIGDYQVAF